MHIQKNAMFSSIYEVDCFEKEFTEMTKEGFRIKPPYPRYQNWLIGKLKVLEEYKEKAIQLRDFEKLENCSSEIYCIRYPRSKLNMRILYVYFEDGEVLLLTAFKEKSKKDYKKYITLAQKRIKEINKEV